MCEIKKAKFLIVLLLVFYAGTAFSQDIFSYERNLVSVLHIKNYAKSNKDVVKFLSEINPNFENKRPLFFLLEKLIYNSALKKVDTAGWVDALYFTQPLERENDWVYAFHVINRTEYVEALNRVGSIRLEEIKDGITQYRESTGVEYNVFYMAFPAPELAILSHNRAAVQKALSVYQKVSEAGLFYDDDSDFVFSAHLNRYFLTNSRLVENFLEMSRKDLLRDLAGTTSKLDNPLNYALVSYFERLEKIIRELAVVKVSGNATESGIELSGEVDLQYSGNLHYAFLNFSSRGRSLAYQLPASAIAYADIKMWPEQYVQLLESIADTSAALLGGGISRDITKEAKELVALAKKIDPQENVSAIIMPSEDNKSVGPFNLSLMRVEDPVALKKFWKKFSSLISLSQLSELFAEKGIKFDIEVDQAGLMVSGVEVSRAKVHIRSSYFSPPGIFAKAQRYFVALHQDTLIMLSPSAPLNLEQYNEQEPYALDIISEVIAQLENPDAEPARVVKASEAVLADDNLFTAAASPLALVQAAMLSEAVWPQRKDANKLPVPWKLYAKQFFSFSDSDSVCSLVVRSKKTSAEFNLNLPLSSLKALAEACLNLKPPVIKEEY